MFLDGLDELDQKIIQLLIKNARMSYSDIGQQIGISRVAVKMRVQALEQKGIIEEYTTIINPQKISGDRDKARNLDGGSRDPPAKRHRDPDLPGHGKKQAACARGRRLQ